MAEQPEPTGNSQESPGAKSQTDDTPAEDREEPGWAPSYSEVDPGWVGKEAATGLIRAWIDDAYDELRPRTGAPRLDMDWDEHVHFPLTSQHKVWYRLSVSRLLWAWMIVVTKEPTVAQSFGETKEPWDTPYFRLHRLALGFLNRLVSVSWPQMDEAVFGHEADILWEYLHLGQVTYESGVIVYNLRGSGDETDLGESIRLRPVTKEWAESRFTGLEELPESLWAIAFTYSVPMESINLDGWSFDGNKTRNALIERGLLRLRLVNPQHYFISGPYRLTVSGSYETPMVEQTGKWVSVLTEFRPVTITAGFLAQVGQAGKLIPREDQSPPLLGLILRSFQASFVRIAREAWPDRVVDLVICLEAMFSGATGEISHHVAIRYALLLGKNREDSVKRMQTMIALYNLRSRIVHAGVDRRDSAANDVIRKWLGEREIPQKIPDRGPLASTMAARFVADALLAFLRLRAAGVDPFPEKRSDFFDDLDHLAFDAERRTQMQVAAGVLESL